MAISVAQRMKDTGGRATGFDYMRVALASSIILWHSISTCYGSAYEVTIWRGPLGVLMHIVLPMFFALSGFLVAGSLERSSTLVSYFGLRILRIVPALAVEVLLSALIFGPILSTVPLGQYYTSGKFWAYFLNMVGYIHYQLPGVFVGNPLPNTVNAQLWTVPFELQCYMALGALAVIGIIMKRRLLWAIVLLGQAMWAWQAIKLGDNGATGGASGPVLVISFLAGLLFYLERERMAYSAALFWVALIACLGLSALPHGSFYLPLPATYLTVYLGLRNPPKVKYLMGGDYSYGLYLYGFPVQQAFVSFGPSVHHWWLNILVCWPAAFAIACCSWHFVERPALGFRRHLPAIERALVGLVRGRPAAALERASA